MKIKFNLRSTIKNALFAGILAAIAAAPATAQQTPQTYCASLPATSCEVLNVDLGGWANSGTSFTGMGIVKYCRNQQIHIIPFAAGYRTSTNSLSVAVAGALSDSGISLSGNPAIMATNGNQSAWTNAGLCSTLP